MPSFISWLLVLWLQISKLISVPWQSDPFPGKELGHSLKVTHFRGQAKPAAPRHLPSPRGLKPDRHLPERPTGAQKSALTLVRSVGDVQTWALQHNPLWPPALWRYFVREGCSGRALCDWDQTALQGSVAVPPGFVMPSLDSWGLCCMSSFDKLCSRKHHFTQTACCKKTRVCGTGKETDGSL